MSSNNSLSELGNLLVSSLEYIDNYDNNQQRNKQSDIFYINTAGSKLTHAYEQIRNASEYADDHLFRQRLMCFSSEYVSILSLSRSDIFICALGA